MVRNEASLLKKKNENDNIVNLTYKELVYSKHPDKKNIFF